MKRGEDTPILSLPWAAEDEWLEVHQCLDFLFARHSRELEKVSTLARQIRSGFEYLDGKFREYSGLVCPGCREVCCLHARVAFDFKDLLLIHALGLDPPPHQLRRHDEEHCRYLGAEGCRLERLRRPFVCTWYFCEPMLKLYRRETAREQRRFSETIKLVQFGRNRIEEEFIFVTTAGQGDLGLIPSAGPARLADESGGVPEIGPAETAGFGKNTVNASG